MLLIYLPQITPRCEYVFDLIFKEDFGLEYKLTTDQKYFTAYADEKLSYAENRFSREFHVKAHLLLFEKEIAKKEIAVDNKFEMPVIFVSDNSCDLNFDVFAAVFYMVSRYEEYLPFVPDKFGRFKPADSLAFKNNFLQKPVVNIWINIFKRLLAEKFPLLKFKTSSFKTILTYDIDIAYAYSGRSKWRIAGATIKDLLQLKFKNIKHRFAAQKNITQDPWNVYEDLLAQLSQQEVSSVFFFLLGDYSAFDKNLEYDHPLMKALVQRVSAVSDVGIHPSFYSSISPQKIVIEMERLEKLSGKKIYKSRQHYLKFILPDTYNKLIKAGITEEYSMGFAGMPGFRAGTCKPFYFYDLVKEQTTSLKIFPVTFMEGNFLYYLKISPAAAWKYIFQLINEVREVKGTFISIWHNHTLSDTPNYKEWKSIHVKMIENILEHKGLN